MVGKFYAITNEDAIKKGTVISTFFALVVAGGCYFLGGFGRLYDINVEVDGFDSIIPSMLSTLPAVIIAIIIVLVLSASMSTLSSLVLTSSSTITLDFIAPLRKKPIKETTKVVIMRSFIVVFVIISAYIAIRQAHAKSLFIAQMMGISWGALAGSFLAPFMYGLYTKHVSRVAVACCFIWATCLEILQLFISLGMLDVSGSALLAFVFRNSLYSGVFGMVGGLVIVPIVTALTRKAIPDNTEEIFSCYKPRRTVGIADNLGE